MIKFVDQLSRVLVSERELGILYVCVCVRLCACLSFVLNALFNLSQMSPGGVKTPFPIRVMAD